MMKVLNKLWNLTLCLLLGHLPGKREVTRIFFGAHHIKTTCSRCGTEWID